MRMYPAPTWDTACTVTGSYTVRQLTHLAHDADIKLIRLIRHHNFILHTVAAWLALRTFGSLGCPYHVAYTELLRSHPVRTQPLGRILLFCKHKATKRFEYY